MKREPKAWPGPPKPVAQSEAEDAHEERRAEERAGEPPPRRAIISIHGKDVEECEIPERRHRRRAA